MTLNFICFILGILVFNFLHNYLLIPRQPVNPKETGFFSIRPKERRKAIVQDDEKALKAKGDRLP